MEQASDTSASVACPEAFKQLQSFQEQNARWPQTGRHILAHWDETSVIVYQAFNAEIAAFAVQNQKFGGTAYSFSRMTWIKTNFLWMMYRSDWSLKDTNQERILAITLNRNAFENILALSWPSNYGEVAQKRFNTREEWQHHKGSSRAVLQWDPDHLPDGSPCKRRAIQIGIRSEINKNMYNTENCILAIEDITPFVLEQHLLLRQGQDISIPKETVYIPLRKELISILGLAN